MYSDDFNQSPFKRSPFRRLMAKWFGFWERLLNGISAASSSLVRPLVRLQHKLFIEPLQKWQLSAEENRARNAKPSVIRRFMHAVNYRLWRMSEWFEARPTYFRWLTVPLRRISRIPGRIGMVLGNGLEGLEKRLERSRWLFWLGYPVAGVRYLASAAYEFSSAWYFSRDFRLLLGAIPAILLFCPLAYCMVRVSFRSPVATASRYRTAANEAKAAKRYEEARLCYRKIQQLGLFAEKMLYELATNDDAAGNTDQAIEQMQELLDQYPDFAPAQLWMVQKLLAGEVTDDRAAAFEQAESYLKSVLDVESDSIAARYLQANLWARQGKAAEAVQALNEIRGDYPPANVLLSSIQRRQGLGQDADATLKRALAFYEQRSPNELSAQDYLNWSATLAESGAFSAAEQRLNEALERNDDNQQLPVDAAAALSQLAARVGAFQPQEFLRLMRRAIELDAKDDYLMSLTYAAEQTATRAEALRFLDERAKVAPLPLEVEITLGVQAFKVQDYKLARGHFERVVAMDATNAGAANNLAWLLTETEPVDLNRGLEIANRAVELAPDRPEYRDTRGQILTKLKRWQEAALDLEYAVNGLTETAQTHQSLANVYEQLGNRELAAAHRQSARTAQ